MENITEFFKTESAVLVYIGMIICSSGYGFCLLGKVWKVFLLMNLVISEETNKLSEIKDFLKRDIEIYSEITGEFLISPVSKTKCVKYKVEIFMDEDGVELAESIGLGGLSSSIVEDSQIEDVYLKEGNKIISVNLDRQKKVYLRNTEWHRFNLSSRTELDNYLKTPAVQNMINAKSFVPSRVFGVRESLIPHDEKVYLLGKVEANPPKSGEYIETENQFEFLPYTLVGHMDSVSEEHFKKFLRGKILFLSYMATCFLGLSILIIYALVSN